MKPALLSIVETRAILDLAPAAGASGGKVAGLAAAV